MQKTNKFKEGLLTTIFVVLSVLVIIPLIILISTSVSSEKDIADFGYRLIPKSIDFTAYRYIMKNPTQILNAYQTTFIFSVASMVLGLLLMSMVAYALSRRDFKARRFFSFFMYFTTMFGGGLVPSYILITQYLHLQDTIWVYIIPSLIAPFNIFMIRTNFQALPIELTESALIDGAGEYTIFFKIIMPLSKPVLATVALFTFLGKWNDWMTSMLYINNRDDLISLQYLLQRLMQNIELLKDENISSYTQTMEIPSETVRMAMAVVAAGPVLVVFPFFQKYFTRGMTVGSVKG